MAMPQVDARKPVVVDAGEASTFPDFALMQLLVFTNPSNMKKTASIRLRPYNFATKTLGPQGVGIVKLHFDDLEAAAVELPALQALLDGIGSALAKLASRQQIKAEIDTIDHEIAALNEGADDSALQAAKAALVEELATVETALGKK